MLVFQSCTDSTKSNKSQDSVMEIEFEESAEEDSSTAPDEVDAHLLQTDFSKWAEYHFKNIDLNSDFKALDQNDKAISKETFLRTLSAGKALAIQVDSNLYKLSSLDSSVDKTVKVYIVSEGRYALKHYLMEGNAFPQFDLTDLDGNRFTNSNTIGKVKIFKTWFIRCKACVAEFPELNELVGRYKNSKDTLFISLALDDESDLRDFLKKKNFKYKVVANQESLITKKLDLNTFPTHLVVDENNKIIKVVNKAKELIHFLREKNSK